jgi:hypothetical protein
MYGDITYSLSFLFVLVKQPKYIETITPKLGMPARIVLSPFISFSSMQPLMVQSQNYGEIESFSEEI